MRIVAKLFTKVRSPSILFFLLLTLLPAHALIGTQYQMQLGNPSGAIVDSNNHTNYLIQRTVQALSYNDTLGEPNWASWDLTISDVGSTPRGNFATDTNLPSTFYRVTTSDYTGSGYDRGHMCPSGDRTDNVTNNDLVFFMSNIIPQSPVNNQVVWANFESYCRTLAQDGNELLITCGPGGFGTSKIQPSGKVFIPSFVWKVVVVVGPGAGMATNRITETNRVITIKIPNNDNVSSSWQNYLTSPQQIQNDTGFTFFTGLTPTIAAALRMKVDGQTNAVTATDLTVASTHAGDFTQGDTNVLYTLTVNNIGGTASSGTVNVTNSLPNGLTATAITGAGWSVNLASLSATRSDSLAGGSNFPPIYITANVATNAAALVTNTVTVAGGGDSVLTDNSSWDETIINPFFVNTNTGTPVLLVGFDVSAQTNYSASPLLPTAHADNISFSGLTRGSGVTTNTGTAAARAWGGVNWTNISAATAIAANRFFTFSVTPNSGYKVSCTSIPRFDYRRSATGATNGVLQYQIGSGSFTDITNLTYSSSASSGATNGLIDLSNIAALQNVTNSITFRIANFNGTGSSGSFYIYDFANSTNADFELDGIVVSTTVVASAPILSLDRSGSQISVNLLGTTGANYILQATTNLSSINWIPLITNGAPFTFVETNVNLFNQRFYRALVAP